MIQRIQTIWFFFATLTFFALFLFAFVHYSENGTPKALKVTGVYENRTDEVVSTQDFLALTVATALIGVLPFIAIFLFRNRKQQITLAYIAIIAVLGHFFWLYQTTRQVIGNFDLQPENYSIGIVLPSLTILFLIFAIKGIRKDERLIRSTDRLRG